LTDIGTDLSFNDIFEVLDVSESNPSQKNKRVSAANLRTLLANNPSQQEMQQGAAGESILAPRLLVMVGDSLYNFDPTNTDHYNKVVGISIAPGNINTVIDYVKYGVWKTSLLTNITPNAIYYANSDGILTTVTPAEGIFQEVGFGMDVDTLFVRI